MGPCAYFVLILATSCGTKTARVADSGSTTAPSRAAVEPQDRLFYLDLNAPTLVQPIETDPAIVRDSKFARIEVVSALNAKKYPVTVQVDYAPPNGARVHLGSFSLFPADRPGKFIVPTQGKVRDGGAIVLSLQRPEQATPSDTVRLSVRRVQFVSR
jgi:hypothetical protein